MQIYQDKPGKINMILCTNNKLFLLTLQVMYVNVYYTKEGN